MRGSGPDPAILKNSSTSVSVTTSSAQRVTCFATIWDHLAAVLATILPPSSKPSCASFRDRWPRISYRRLDAFLPAPRHIRSMIGYKVVLDGVPAFAVEITCTDGAHSLRGFRTEAAALMWIADQEFRAANAEAVATDACIRLRGSEDSALVALYGR